MEDISNNYIPKYKNWNRNKMPEVLNIGMKGTEERIIEMEDKTLEITPSKEQRKK